MTPHPVDLLLARAQSHLTGARYAQAVGAFRAAVGVGGTCPKVVHAHLGLAAALHALGRREEAVAGLVAAAEGAVARGWYDEAMRLWAHAIVIDPSRMELHLDLAMAEEAMGRHDAAVARIEGLADRYMDAGRYDEAAELLRCLSQWAADAEVERAEPVAVPLDATPRNTALITGETVIALDPRLAIQRDDEVTRVDAPLMLVPPAPASEAEAEAADGLESRITLVHGGALRPQPAARRPAPRPAPAPAGSAVVERLRARAGLGHAAASPRRASVRVTAPIAIRGGERWAVQDEDVTRYFRRPQGLPAAS